MPPPLYILSSFDVSQTIDGSTVCFHELRLIYKLEIKCVPLEDLFRNNPGAKSTEVRSVKEPDITDLLQVYLVVRTKLKVFGL